MRVEISTLFGLDVYTDKGIYVGRVNDVQLDLDEQKIIGLATNRLNPNLFDTTNHGVIIPFRWVLAIADIVLIRQVAKQFTKPEKEEEEI